MSDGDGLALLEKLRVGEFHYVPFILMSGAVTKEVLKNVVHQGADGVLLKPFSGDTLIKKISEAIANRE
ncbi:MAG: response regulator [Oligoflexia bacterium]|nr:response regulator [Oligoflexia bacterium]